MPEESTLPALTEAEKKAIKQLNDLVPQRERLFTRLQNAYDLIQCLPEKKDIFITRCEMLDSTFDKFEIIQNQLITFSQIVPAAFRVETAKTMESFEEVFYHVKTVFRKLMSSEIIPQGSASSVSERRDNVKLPNIEVPKFSGNLKDWLYFSNLFEATIHKNSSIESVSKFHYLLSCLEGEALDIIRNIPITSKNYDVAWKLLSERYQDERQLITYHLTHIIDLSPIKTNTAAEIRQFTLKFKEHQQALYVLGYEVSKSNHLLVLMLLRKVSDSLRSRFENTRVDKKEFPSAIEIISFLDAEALAFEHSSFDIPQCKGGRSQSSLRSMRGSSLMTAFQKKCKLCSRNHSIFQCEQFTKLNPQNRYNFIKSKQWCINCLGAHDTKSCGSKHTCKKCTKRHHTLLHFDHEPRQNEAKTDQKSSRETNLSSFNNCTSTVLLGTAVLKIYRAVIDTASHFSAISEKCARLIGAVLEKSPSRCGGLSGTPVISKGDTYISIFTTTNQKVKRNHLVRVFKSITSSLTLTRISSEVRMQLKTVKLADPQFDIPSPVDMLIGADLYPTILTGKMRQLGPSLPVASGTVFGAVIIGPTPCLSPIIHANEANVLLTLDTSLETAIQRFWQAEEPPPVKHLSKSESWCESHFEKTHTRDSEGRYTVRLPFRADAPKLGDSFQMTKKRFQLLETKLNANADLKIQYTEFMRDYLEMGHMQPINQSFKFLGDHYFLPHHGVLKENSSTTKLRVVFDASSKTTVGVSLNDTLYSGPALQNDLCDVVARFRRHAIMLVCDIKQMYRQIKIHPDDQKYQLILWREKNTSPLLIYQLTTVTYGTTCAPYLAIRALQQLVKDEGHKWPKASQVLLNDILVDDIVTSTNTVEEATVLQSELVNLLALGGFTLRKWITNAPSLLNAIPLEDQEKPFTVTSAEQPLFNILGLRWIAASDVFSYKIQIPKVPLTKRGILSTIAQIYDPCGWLSPTIFWAKSFMQILWTKGLSWDEQLTQDLQIVWKQFISNLPALESIQIERLLISVSCKEIELHGFSDASEKGYSGVVYVKSLTDSKIRILIAKTRVAPLKRISLPRLELCGAHLVANLLSYAQKLLETHHTIKAVYAWSDSTVALCWIKTPPYRLKTYVANRVTEIQNCISPAQWRHVNSAQNPADCASRGLPPSALVNFQLWWSGPAWLKRTEEFWPSMKINEPLNLPDLKPVIAVGLVTTTVPFCDWFTRYSSWSTLTRVIAYIIRFTQNCRTYQKKGGSLTVSEVQYASYLICRMVQHEVFFEHICDLKAGKLCQTTIQRLSPFLDTLGIIRVGGRIRNAPLNFNDRHPILLPKKHPITNLIVDYYHKTYLHAGPQLLQSLVRRNFWILSSRSVVRSRIYQCIRCLKCKPVVRTPLMGDLPRSRVTMSRPFSQTGIDYGGPLQVKVHTVRNAKIIKAYICTFVCFSTKAVHIEPVTDMTSESFIAALSRFTSRRGVPSDIYSDCGTNFVGASKILTKLVNEFLKNPKTQDAVLHFSTGKGIKFHFNPPAAPHQGGLWESAIKSIKGHLKRVVGNQTLFLEDFFTLLCKIEAMLNSRPLSPLTHDPSEQSALTPGHFLTGDALAALPEPDLTTVPINRLKRWQLTQAFSQRIWRRWYLEYINTLQQRSKWIKPLKDLDIGDLVLVSESNSPPLKWPLARVLETYPGKDNVVRVVKLKLQSGTVLRPVVKLCPLPCN